MLQSLFNKYNDSKKIKNSEYCEMRDKRDLLLEELKSNDELPSFTLINLGSYALRTGVKYKDNNYDIDCGIRFNINENELDEEKAHKIKKEVCETYKRKRKARWRRKCISALYHQDDRPKYHLDFPVFAFDDDSQRYYLADGKQHEKVTWVPVEPKKLMDYLDPKDFNENVRDQYRRNVRYLKLWKSKIFSSEKSDAVPPSIGLTIIANEVFQQGAIEDDLNALIKVANRMKGKIHSNKVNLTLPKSPNNQDVFYKMNEDLDLVNKFSEKVDELIETLNEAQSKQTQSLEETCKLLRKVFPDFPLPEKEDAEDSFVGNASYGL